MTYIDYAYYSGVYVGNVNEEEFPRLAVRASAYLDYYTQNKARDSAELDEVKMCCCALVDQYKTIETAQTLVEKKLTSAVDADAEIKSETVGSYSRTLATGASDAAEAISVAGAEKQRLAETCREYLTHTGLLYRGGAKQDVRATHRNGFQRCF